MFGGDRFLEAKAIPASQEIQRLCKGQHKPRKKFPRGGPGKKKGVG